MANMSYVMYENTLNDLRDVYADMRNRAEEDLDAAEYGAEFERLNESLSKSEAMARAQLVDLCRRIVELEDRPVEEDEPNEVERIFKVLSENVIVRPDLSTLTVSRGNIRYLINDEWFIWRDEEHHFLSKVSDDEYYWQLNACLEGNALLEEAFDVMEGDDDSYGYKDQKNFD